MNVCEFDASATGVLPAHDSKTSTKHASFTTGSQQNSTASSVAESEGSLLQNAGAILSIGGGILGLALARIGLLTGTYTSYNETDAGIFTDGATFCSLIVMAILLAALGLSKVKLRRRTVTILALVCMIGESALLFAQGFACLNPLCTDEMRFIFAVGLTLTTSGSMYYWLRRAKGATNTVAIVYVYGALIASEILLAAISFLSEDSSFFVAGAASLLQLGCLGLVFHGTPMRNLQKRQGPAAYFGYVRSVVDDKRFLVSTAIGIGLLGIVDGFLRGYPDGLPIAFTTPTRLGYACLTIAIAALIIVYALRGRTRAMTMGIWIVMELMAAFALLCFALFPNHLEYGALFTTTLNALMVGLVFYTVVAFESKGWRDPYYYALAGWLVWLGCRSVARIVLLAVYPLYANDPVINTLLCILLLISTQVVFGSCLRDVGSYGCANLDTTMKPVSDVRFASARATATAAHTPVPTSQPWPGASEDPTGREEDGVFSASPGADEIRARVLADMVRDQVNQSIDGMVLPEDLVARPQEATTQALVESLGKVSQSTTAEGAVPTNDVHESTSTPAASPTVTKTNPATPLSPGSYSPYPEEKNPFRPAAREVPAPNAATPVVPLSRLMGLDDRENPAALGQSDFGQAVETLGQQFMISEREIEVLTLYALGYTQKRVAEELHISQGTAHTHIKRIYAKTGFHSRQDVIDFLNEYSG